MLFNCIWQGVSSATYNSWSVLDQVVWVFLDKEGELAPAFSWDVKPWNGRLWLDWIGKRKGEQGTAGWGKHLIRHGTFSRPRPCLVGLVCAAASGRGLPAWAFWAVVLTPMIWSSSWMEGLDFSCLVVIIFYHLKTDGKYYSDWHEEFDCWQKHSFLYFCFLKFQKITPELWPWVMACALKNNLSKFHVFLWNL